MVDWGILRVSSEEQAKTGVSLGVQQQELLKPSTRYPDKSIAEDQILMADGESGGFKVGQTLLVANAYDEVRNSLRPEFMFKERSDLTVLFQRLKEGDRVFFTKFDRVSRDFAFLHFFVLWCGCKGVQLCPLQDSTDELTRHFMSVVSYWERQRTITRTTDVQRAFFERGIHAFRPPFGYQKNTKSTTGRLRFPKLPEGVLILKPAEAVIIKDLFEQTVAGVRYNELCAKHKVPERSYYRIIRNELYCGLIKCGKDVRVGNHEPIISRELWEQANRQLKKYRTWKTYAPQQ